MRLCPDALALTCHWTARPPIMAMTAIFDSADKTRQSAPPNIPAARYAPLPNYRRWKIATCDATRFGLKSAHLFHQFPTSPTKWHSYLDNMSHIGYIHIMTNHLTLSPAETAPVTQVTLRARGWADARLANYGERASI